MSRFRCPRNMLNVRQAAGGKDRSTLAAAVLSGAEAIAPVVAFAIAPLMLTCPQAGGISLAVPAMWADDP